MTFTSQVRFLPWVGSRYRAGLQGAKTLILGESHYQKNGKDYSRNLNIELIAGQADKTGTYLGRYPFWTKIIKLASPHDINPNRFWHSVAYFNYIQEFVGLAARERPTKQMWEDASEPFYEVLQELKPDFILTLGNHLWDHLPGKFCSDIDGEPNSTYCKYVLDGHTTVTAKSRHPSSFGFTYSAWQPVVQHGLYLARRYKDAEQGAAANP